jgi:glycosyltransferase involved in cell wall biosynthesis
MEESFVPAVSVVMPVYNTSKYLHAAIDSILCQTFQDFEFIIIDDASTDNSAEIIKSYSDSRIILIEKPKNTGYTDSLNMAIKLAKGNYVARMDADDISLKNRFEKQVNYMEEHPDVLVLGTFYKVINSESVVAVPISYEEAKVVSIMHVPVAHPTVFIRRNVFTGFNLVYDKAYEPAEDYHLWTRIIEIGKIENLPEVLLHYRRHENQQSSLKIVQLLKAAQVIRFNQLSKLISFENKTYDLGFAIDVLTKTSIPLTMDGLKKVDRLLCDLYESNIKKGVYNDEYLYVYLRNVWLQYLNFSNVLDFKRTSFFLFNRNSRVTKMTFANKLKLLWDFISRKLQISSIYAR